MTDSEDGFVDLLTRQLQGRAGDIFKLILDRFKYSRSGSWYGVYSEMEKTRWDFKLIDEFTINFLGIVNRLPTHDALEVMFLFAPGEEYTIYELLVISEVISEKELSLELRCELISCDISMFPPKERKIYEQRAASDHDLFKDGKAAGPLWRFLREADLRYEIVPDLVSTYRIGDSPCQRLTELMEIPKFVEKIEFSSGIYYEMKRDSLLESALASRKSMNRRNLP